MAKKVITTKKTLIKKKKKWYSIISTKDFSNLEIGETLASEDKELIGKTVSLALGVITGQIRKQNVKVMFKIKEVREGKALTELIGCSLVPNYVKRCVRKGKSKIDDSFMVKTKDNVNVVVKPFIITRNKTHGGIMTSIRVEARKLIKEFFEKNTFNDIINKVLSTEFQKELKNRLKVIYPLSIVEIRELKRK